MKRIGLLLLFLQLMAILIFTSCNNYQLEVTPDTYLSKDDQQNLKIELSRYMDKLPPNTTLDMRWDSSRFEYYKRGGELMDLMYLYKSDTSQFYYFAISRVAPSVREGERKVIVGKCTFDTKKISAIEEFFISIVEDPEVLKEQVKPLFIKTIEINKAPIPNKYIEWPNDYFYYNKNTNQWDRVSTVGATDPLNNSIKIQ